MNDFINVFVVSINQEDQSDQNSTFLFYIDSQTKHFFEQIKTNSKLRDKKKSGFVDSGLVV